MEDTEHETLYAIPTNYTDSGKLFGGMIETRNAVETLIIAVAIGYPELMFINMPGTVRAVVMTLTVLPPSIIALMGIDGYSLMQYLWHIIVYLKRQRRLHFRIVGHDYEQRKKTRKQKNSA